jgi:hypothetical protein
MESLALAAAALASAATVHPLLTLAHGSLHGSQFHPREKVHVTLMLTSKVVRTVRTSARGTFTLATPESFDPCVGAVVIAAGVRGDVARLKVMPRGCLPPGTTP